MTTDIIHKAPFPDCSPPTEDAVWGVLPCNKASDEKVKVEPPTEWGPGWRWNLTEDGTGVYFRNL